MSRDVTKRRVGSPLRHLVLITAALLLASTMPPSTSPTEAGEPPSEPEAGPALYADEVMADEPLAFYRMGDTGSTAVDSSGNDRHGTYPAATTTGEPGALLDDPDTAVSSTAGSWAMTAPDVGHSTGADPFSVEMWSDTTSTGRWLWIYGNRVGLYLRNATEVSIFYGPGSTQHLVFGLPHGVTDSWHLWTVTYDGVAFRLYLDGALLGVRSLSFSSSLGAGLRIGDGAGRFDEVSYYEDALPNERVVAHWSRGMSRRADACVDPGVAPSELESPYAASVMSDSPLAYYRMGERSSDSDARVVFDASGGCRNGSTPPDTSASAGALVGDDDGALSQASSGRWALSATAEEFPHGSEPFSVEMWSDSISSNLFLWHYGSTVGLYPRDSREIRIYRGSTYLSSRFWLPHSYMDGEWHHWVVTYDGSAIRLFFDGVMVGAIEQSISTSPAGNALHLGQAIGAYDEVAVFDHALSAAQVAKRVADAAKADTTTSLTGPDGEWREIDDLDFDVVVDAPVSEDVPTGEVELFDGTTSLGVEELDGDGEASFTLQLPEGNRLLRAEYHGDDDFVASRSSVLEHVVVEAIESEVALILDPSPAAYDAPVTAEIEVTAVGESTPVPSGEVELVVDEAVVQTADLETDGTVELELPVLDVGEHVVQARYAGDVRFLAAESEAVDHTVIVAATTIEVAGPVEGESVFTEPVVFTAEVAAVAPSRGPPGGSVTFFVDDVEVDEQQVVDGQASSDAIDDLDIGEHEVSATFQADQGFEDSETASPASHEVLPASTSLVLEADDEPSAVGSTVTFTASVAAAEPATGSPSGQVRFLDRSQVLDLVEVEDGVAAVEVSGLEVGVHVISAELVPDTGWLTSSDQLEQRVLDAVTVEVDGPLTAVFGQLVAFEVRVGSEDEIPSGSVQLVGDGDVVFADADLDEDGEAILFTSQLPVGTNELTVQYHGDDLHAAAASAVQELSVTRGSTFVQVRTNPDPSGVDQAVSVVATVVPLAPSSGQPGGFVSLYLDAESTPSHVVAVGPAGTAAVELAFAEAGDRQIVGVYGGDDSFLGATSAASTHRVAPSTETSLVSDPSASTYGEAIELTATVTSSGGTPAGEVRFFDGEDQVGSSTLDEHGVASVEVAGLAAGTRTLTASFAGSAFGPSTSSVHEHAVGAAGSAVTLSSEPTEPVYGQPVTVTATVEGPSSVAPGGFVAFTLEGGAAGTAALVDGEATLVLDDLDVGTHEVGASYGGSANGSIAPAEAEPIDLEVGRAAVEVEVSGAGGPTAPEVAVQLEVQVRAAAPGAGTPTGEVELFDDDERSLGGATLHDGRASISVTTLDEVGTWSITAHYEGDARFEPGDSSPVEHRVNDAVDVTVTPPAIATALGATADFEVTVEPAAASPETPSGQVLLLVGSIPAGVGELDGEGTATVSTWRLHARVHEITARYLGDEGRVRWSV